MKKRRLKVIISVIALLLVAFFAYALWANTSLDVTQITVTESKLPKAFDGFRIVQISDLHNAEFGKDNEKLISRISELKPDIIVLTGDFYDSRKGGYDVPLNVAKNAVSVAPTYFVSGNHEAIADDCRAFLEELKNVGVTVLTNEAVTIEKDGEKINIAGISDPTMQKSVSGSPADKTKSALDKIGIIDSGYTVLLAHRPEHIDIYSDYGYDLVFSGHAHGGQFRLPFIGGLYAPHQGIFPKYTQGLHTIGETNLIVSRGLGNSSFPFRINNKPVVVEVELKALRG